MTKDEATGLVAQFGEEFPELLALTEEARKAREATPLLTELRKRFPNEVVSEEAAEAAKKIGDANGLHPGLVMTVLLAAEKEGWKYVG